MPPPSSPSPPLLPPSGPPLNVSMGNVSSTADFLNGRPSSQSRRRTEGGDNNARRTATTPLREVERLERQPQALWFMPWLSGELVTSYWPADNWPTSPWWERWRSWVPMAELLPRSWHGAEYDDGKIMMWQAARQPWAARILSKLNMAGCTSTSQAKKTIVTVRIPWLDRPLSP